MKTTPIHWTAKSITVGDKEFDAATHMLSMIYPNPDNPKRYLVQRDQEFPGSSLSGDQALLGHMVECRHYEQRIAFRVMINQLGQAFGHAGYRRLGG